MDFNCNHVCSYDYLRRHCSPFFQMGIVYLIGMDRDKHII